MVGLIAWKTVRVERCASEASCKVGDLAFNLDVEGATDAGEMRGEFFIATL
jgi:hypothetical protein